MRLLCVCCRLCCTSRAQIDTRRSQSTATVPERRRRRRTSCDMLTGNTRSDTRRTCSTATVIPNVPTHAPTPPNPYYYYYYYYFKKKKQKKQKVYRYIYVYIGIYRYIGPSVGEMEPWSPLKARNGALEPSEGPKWTPGAL